MQRQDRLKAAELTEYGVAVGEIASSSKHNRLFVCLMKGVLIFMACFGTIDSLMSAFSISYNKFVVILFVLGSSFVAAMMYYNKVLFYSGYFVMMTFFTVELIRYYLYINSGYQALLNILHKQYSDFYEISAERAASEAFTNRYVTITMALVFIGFALVILLNIAISGYMSIFETILLTAPFIEIALFVGKIPKLLPLSMVVGTYIAVALLQCSQNARMQVKHNKNSEFIRRKFRKQVRFFYQGNAAAMVYLCSAGLVIALVLFAVLKPMQKVEDKERITKSSLRAELDSYVEIFLYTGFSGLLNQYASTGGLSGGRLGGVSSVRPDFQTDLIATFAPYSSDTVYLKAFTGSTYSGKTWSSLSRISTEASGVFTQDKLDLYENSVAVLPEGRAKMVIENIGADSRFTYLPYTSFRGDVTSSGSEMTIFYHPYTKEIALSESISTDDGYQAYLLETCTYVTAEQTDYLTKWSKENGIPGRTEYPGADASTEELFLWKMKVAEAIEQVFLQSYPYTMSPGSTPVRADFVEYFLTEQKRGYCAHFASAAVLLLRNAGIPARYIEGYCIPPSLVTESELLTEEEFSEWFMAEKNQNTEAVMKVEIPDANAHAWVEIYLDGYGFVPYEFTPPSDEEEYLESSFWAGLFRGLFKGVQFQGNTQDEPVEETEPDAGKRRIFSVSSVSIFFPIVVLLIIALLFVVVSFIVVMCRRKIHLYLMWKREQYKDLIAFYYQRFVVKLVRCLKNVQEPFPVNFVPRDVSERMNLQMPDRRDVHEKWVLITERACFSAERLSQEDVSQYLELCKKLLQNAKMSCK